MEGRRGAWLRWRRGDTAPWRPAVARWRRGIRGGGEGVPGDPRSRPLVGGDRTFFLCDSENRWTKVWERDVTKQNRRKKADEKKTDEKKPNENRRWERGNWRWEGGRK